MPKRTYAGVGVVEEAGLFAVALDGRTPRTPKGGRLVLPSRALADAIGAEWAAQTAVVDMTAMPLTRLAFTTLDREPGADEAMAQTLARFADADVLCYFAETPQDLAARQAERWTPLLAWAARDLDLKFVGLAGIVHRPQPPETLARMLDLARAQDVFHLTGLAFAAALFHSAILALSVQHGRLSGVEAMELSRLEEAYQEERWGVDAEAAARTAALREDARAVGTWFDRLTTA